ncbi:hypothetical protein DVR12_19580 [Chitinophaga silvatica]|uniref:Alpha/beta hydrolase n=1 Tax=Chitinophaga silvatica TaxID=2282649 RepID=A0A3E1Y5C3_9BACT|nr:hypothetical protein [Chitinophaga silvatica]RFS19933.1 hypothetical protein DVR12_19580 [Chitinophaga silvatica]
MGTIIFIHGRGQQGCNPSELEKVWTTALEEGLHKTGLSLPEDTRIVFPYYGDILNNLVKEGSGTLEKLLEKGDPTEAEIYFLREVLQELLDNAGVNSLQILENYDENVAERGPQNWGWVIAMARTVDRIPGLRDMALNLATSDVYQYLSLPQVRLAVGRHVSELIDDKPCVIVAHSLGTVVAYNVLHQLPTANIDTLITLGSPLGIRAVKNYLTKPLMMPSCIGKLWFNALDRNDIVALKPLTRQHFPVTPEIVNKTDLVNGTSNRHGIEGYLSDPEVAGIIYQGLRENIEG